MANSNLQEKLDSGLKAALRAWHEAGASDQPDAGIGLSLRYEGDLASIEALGFKTDMVSRDAALGVVLFKDIPALADHPGVLWLSAGRRRRADLNTAVRDIKARATAPVTGAPVDGLWHIPVTGGAITNAAGGTGSGVIVAIIDTGIDYTHPMFMNQLGPTFQTRILKIWDQGLTPTVVGDCPNAARLVSSNTYGVEYDEHEIEDDLNKTGPAILHRDCDGHGTHCAGIAAGGSLFPTGGNAQNVGVAPQALLIAVKFLDTPDHIFYKMPDNSVGGEVDWEHRFKDAVVYCLRTARDEFDFPIVISLSFGDGSMPGDGLDNDARFVDELIDPTLPADADHFPMRALIVKSSGNDGDVTDRQTAQIVVPAGGTITIPFELTDTRGTLQTQWDQCAQQPFKPRVGVHFWYRPAPIVGAIQFSARAPHGGFTAPISNGADIEIGYRALAGPPPSAPSAPVTAAFHRLGLESEAHPAVALPGGAGFVHRHHVHFYVRPKEVGATSYNPGIYEVRIDAPAGTKIYVMCSQRFWAAGKAVIFAVATRMQDPLVPLPGLPNLVITEESSSVDPLGRNVITVASYDDQDGGGSALTRGRIADSSSRGPLRDFSDPASPLPVIGAKPDIAAPGVRIMSAEGRNTEQLVPPTPEWYAGRRFARKSGTSMATPMVAGVVALMLHKRGTLNITDVRTALLAAPRPAVIPPSAPESTNAYGSGRVDAMTSHSNTP